MALYGLFGVFETIQEYGLLGTGGPPLTKESTTFFV